MKEELNSNKINRDNIHAYESNLEHLADEFRRLDLLLHIQVLKQKQKEPSSSLELFQGLVISEAEITSIFTNHQLADEIFTKRSVEPQYQTLIEGLKQFDEQIRQRIMASTDQGILLSLPTLSRLFRLNSFEEQCLVMCLAPEIGRQYEKIFAFLQDDVTRKKPSVDLVLNVLCPTLTDKLAARSSFTPASSLMYYRLVQLTDSPVDNPVPLISRFLKLDDRVVDALIGSNHLDARLSHISQLMMVSNEPDPAILTHENKEQVGIYEVVEEFAFPS